MDTIAATFRYKIFIAASKYYIAANPLCKKP
jgi:hypothetical protein